MNTVTPLGREIEDLKKEAKAEENKCKLMILQRYPQLHIDNVTLPQGVDSEVCRLYFKHHGVYTVIDIIDVVKGDTWVRYIGPRKKERLAEWLKQLKDSPDADSLHEAIVIYDNYKNEILEIYNEISRLEQLRKEKDEKMRKIFSSKQIAILAELGIETLEEVSKICNELGGLKLLKELPGFGPKTVEKVLSFSNN